MLKETPVLSVESTVDHSSSKTDEHDAEPGRFLIRIPRSAGGSFSASSTTHDIVKRSIVVVPEAADGEADRDWCSASPNLECGLNRPMADEELKNPAMTVERQDEARSQTMSVGKSESRSWMRSEKAMAVEFEQRNEMLHVRLGCVEYRTFKPLFKTGAGSLNAFLDVRIPVEMFNVTRNVALGKRAFWGGADGLYTDDSDPVCVLCHLGFTVPQNSKFVKATFQVAPRQLHYPSIDMNGVKSREWMIHTGLSIRFVAAQGSAARARRKTSPSPRLPGCTIRFSGHLMAPLMEYSDLLLQLPRVKISLGGKALQLEGSAVYTVRHTDNGYGVWKGEMQMFEGLKWNEIGWTEDGLVINTTFLKISGYRWIPTAV
ncbi:hypothetical protein PSACC_00040 [Paramicrosporidium saccamoebae]|uniref:Uncharacterized protein n=1 Tax=Paramicrosporidium saccamoebae TaxID=1246581 RepID=A0A2H9TQX2_9FUNG|nr:hypothetical protein PSACC_00040 [Paramicrosporidium saccamoebae]